MINLPATALELYESLRWHPFNGAHRPGLAVLCYHGMLCGLTLLADNSSAMTRTAAEPSTASARDVHSDALVHQLANMILHVQSEVTHAD